MSRPARRANTHELEGEDDLLTTQIAKTILGYTHRGPSVGVKPAAQPICRIKGTAPTSASSNVYLASPALVLLIYTPTVQWSLPLPSQYLPQAVGVTYTKSGPLVLRTLQAIEQCTHLAQYS